MISLKKIGIISITGTGVVGSSVGVAYLIKTNYKNSISVSKQIEIEGKKILVNDSIKDTLWQIKLNKYKTKFHTEFSFINQDIKTLKSWCQNELQKEFNSAKNYLATKELCTVPNNEEKLLSISKTIAKDEDWEGIASAYKSNETGSNLIENITKESANAKNIKEWCTNKLSEEYIEREKENVALEKWCTKQ